MSLELLMRCVVVAFSHGYEGDAVLMLSLTLSSFINFRLLLQYRLVPGVVLLFVEVVDGQ